MTSESKLASPPGSPKAHLPLTRVGQVTVRRLALHVIRRCGPRTELRCPFGGSVPLARPLSPSSTSPCGSVSVRQVLRELRVILCQTLQADVGSNADIRNFCPKVVTFSTGLFTQSTSLNYLDACFPQPDALTDPSLGADLDNQSRELALPTSVAHAFVTGQRRSGALTSALCPIRALRTSRIAPARDSDEQCHAQCFDDPRPTVSKVAFNR